MSNEEAFAAAEAKLRTKVERLGGTFVGPYTGSQGSVAIICPAGHRTEPRLAAIYRYDDRLPCRPCDLDGRKAAAEARFREVIAAAGGTVTGSYVTTGTPVAIVCANGHKASPRPNNVLKGHGICRTCARRDPILAEADFRAAVEGLGGTVLGEYRGSGRTIRVRCAQGHESEPFPNNVRDGGGICRFCAGQRWDAYYVVTGPAGVKFGITSGDARQRLRDHRRDGYGNVLCVRTGLPDGLARSLENETKAALRAAAMRPVRGLEYFGPEALPVVMKLADAWLPK